MSSVCLAGSQVLTWGFGVTRLHPNSQVNSAHLPVQCSALTQLTLVPAQDPVCQARGSLEVDRPSSASKDLGRRGCDRVCQDRSEDQFEDRRKDRRKDRSTDRREVRREDRGPRQLGLVQGTFGKVGETASGGEFASLVLFAIF
eukprot:3921422-Rhodomonas_salina.3